ncbi:MAG: sugar phosphate nucleotidyltransferase [Candidatus Limisoma sp.]|nr:sugar phosphate nucleotidyltransferase [Candidatus Limisoma sp.]MDY5999612.1 sugar phosphate nucleotidyltransferase [Candidatus Limisoma sp.]
MEREEIKQHIISDSATLAEALRALNALSGRTMTLFAVDEAGKMTGTITDGDIRRSLISSGRLDLQVKDAMHRQFRYLQMGNIELKTVKELRRLRITLVPVVDIEGRIAGAYDFGECHSILPLDAVLMAGGKGERLRPMTLTTPKPLLKIGDKCIIDYNVEELARNGIENIYVTTNYLAEQLEEHFSTPVGGVMAKCVREPRKLGTIGSVRLVEGLSHDDVLIMNSDLLTTINYEDMYVAHAESGADLTIAAIPYMVSVPFAILHLDGQCVRGLEEKPTYNYYANAGIYMVKRKHLEMIPADNPYDATDLIADLIAKGGKVTYHPINGVWLDIGSPDDFRHAQELIQNKQLSKL